MTVISRTRSRLTDRSKQVAHTCIQGVFPVSALIVAEWGLTSFHRVIKLPSAGECRQSSSLDVLLLAGSETEEEEDGKMRGMSHQQVSKEF